MTCLFVNQLTVIDASLLDQQHGVVGESWIVDITLTGELNDQGMIFDFGHVKKQIKQTIDDYFDHKLLVPGQSSQVNCQDERAEVTFRCEEGIVNYVGPSSGIAVLDAPSIDIDSLTPIITEKVRSILPNNVVDCSLTLRNEVIDGPSYRYSHGLKKHEGACQRIAHGHRSKIEIWQDSSRATSLEESWSAKFANIYIGTQEDFIGFETVDNIEHCRFRYTAQEGAFELLVPKARTYFINTESTVENIAQHIFVMTLAETKGISSLIGKAYEGVEKGAICKK